MPIPVPHLYRLGQEPAYGYCHVCCRKRPIDKSTINNFGSVECEADDEHREHFGPGELYLECQGCGATCTPVFRRVKSRNENRTVGRKSN